ncbi:hypothetical protein C343_02453 [Cryptococcus neoformans C23]|uniref:Uncharacterized protein n=2 Tax=Cryptococcus neoformans TaxID=5207 RepID=A0A854QEK2_CRYNE|nr:hypothetical protein CNAG_07811 [Cryptococcus neoformans var. grubii H99]AUB24026.1 hypothetical protein CKF44_07811 [Cryptococcus neoformans var. grubii]OWZ33492.1 hypothetical protein C347_02521 [Cryptococcus neoformans var. grubii AD2-60a]OWZ45588.1 hypothetical protein C343_02453 [Cryptococcus neoformans var. grubii C23]OWZ47665.1 hypothetical protein C353_02355 [Cryptococcus neoformans var. grubii AD1-83a]OWZ55137.1 hypothetical protein C368_02942 [Cryptococcus neoformans var. grubii 1|eukprot:XP_012048875.1 hypothetical protein CNAG_07811 [Cryptococcus neoformans var. grubii H99]
MIIGRNCKAFLKGLYGLRARSKEKEVIDVLHNWFRIPYQGDDYKFERNISVTLPRIIRMPEVSFGRQLAIFRE